MAKAKAAPEDEAPAVAVISAEPVEIAPGVVARVAEAYEEIEVEGGGVKRIEAGFVVVETADGVDAMPVEAFSEAYPGVAL